MLAGMVLSAADAVAEIGLTVIETEFEIAESLLEVAVTVAAQLAASATGAI